MFGINLVGFDAFQQDGAVYVSPRRILGIDHVDIAYNGEVAYVGMGGGAGRGGRKVQETDSQWQLAKNRSGSLKFGKKCSCTEATDADILDCLKKRLASAGKNCQGDVQDALKDCCLSIVGGVGREARRGLGVGGADRRGCRVGRL